MLVRMSEWDAVREKFTEGEKKILNENITGQVICPRAVEVDIKKAGAVGQKLKRLLRGGDAEVLALD